MCATGPDIKPILIANIMKVFLTGAAGNLGSVVSPQLSEAGHDVVAVDRREGKSTSAIIMIDLLDDAAVRRHLEGCEAVVHLATDSGATPQETYRLNVTISAQVMQAAADLGARQLIYASSTQVFNGDRHSGDTHRPSCLPYLPLDGEVPPYPTNAYAAGKEAGESLLPRSPTSSSKCSSSHASTRC